jgi:hypothetical protein
MNKMLNEPVTGVLPEIALEKEDIYRFLIENSNDIIYVLNLEEIGRASCRERV